MRLGLTITFEALYHNFLFALNIFPIHLSLFRIGFLMCPIIHIIHFVIQATRTSGCKEWLSKSFTADYMSSRVNLVSFELQARMIDWMI